MEHLILTQKEAFELYYIALDATIHYKNEIKKDIRLDCPKDIIEADVRRLDVAKKLLEFMRLSAQPLMISEIELPF